MPKRRGSGRGRTSGARPNAKKELPRVAPEEAHTRGGDRDVESKSARAAGDLEPQNRLEPGPRKERAKGRPGPRLTNHKVRSVWFQARSAWPVREAPVSRLVEERQRGLKGMRSRSEATTWTCIGPTNVGGRLTTLAVHPVHPQRIWAGSAGGGVWYSPDAGATWQPQWHAEDVLNVGALAIDPTATADAAPLTLYCGTGEANLSADSYAGVGLYRTLDGGASWHQLASADLGNVPRRIGVIAIDPFDTRHLCLGGVGFREVGPQGADVGGVFVSTDGGVSWRRETFVSTRNYWCHSVVFHPTRRGVIYAAVTEQGARSGIYRSRDGGATWTHLTNGLPDPAKIGRTSLAISRSHPDTLYAFASDESSGRADLLLGVFRSQDGGGSWTEIGGAHFNDEQQISYGNTIVVHPTDPDHVLCGGVDLHLTRDGGKTWKRVTRWDADREKSKNYAHADHHCLVMPAGTASGRVYSANDGGLDVSEDGGRTWTNRSKGLAVTMYYDMDVAPSDVRSFGGGAQDNGSLVTSTGRSDDHYEILGGDGGWIVYDPLVATRVFASYYNLHIYRFDQDTYADVSPPCDEAERNRIWMAFIVLDPSNGKRVYTGTLRVWRSLNGGSSWRSVSPSLDGSPISCIEVATADPQRVYVGTEDGGIFRSVDGGNTWSANLASSVIPGHTVTRVETSPVDAERVYATVANFGHSHLFRSDDGAVTWHDIDKGQLPDVPHHAIAIPRGQPNTVYVCSDVGVFASLDAGATWMNISGNLPHAMVVDLVYHEGSGTLNAATYGRSLWRLAVRDAGALMAAPASV